MTNLIVCGQALYIASTVPYTTPGSACLHKKTTLVASKAERSVIRAPSRGGADEPLYGSGHGSSVGGGGGSIVQSLPLHSSRHTHLAYTIWLCLGSSAITTPSESTYHARMEWHQLPVQQR